MYVCPPLPWSRRAQRLNCRRKTQRRQQQTGCRENKSCPVANSTRRLSSSTTTLPARGPPVGTTRMLHRTDLEPQRGGVLASRIRGAPATLRPIVSGLVWFVPSLADQTADPSPRRSALPRSGEFDGEQTKQPLHAWHKISNGQICQNKY